MYACLCIMCVSCASQCEYKCVHACVCVIYASAVCVCAAGRHRVPSGLLQQSPGGGPVSRGHGRQDRAGPGHQEWYSLPSCCPTSLRVSPPSHLSYVRRLPLFYLRPSLSPLPSLWVFPGVSSWRRWVLCVGCVTHVRVWVCVAYACARAKGLMGVHVCACLCVYV